MEPIPPIIQFEDVAVRYRLPNEGVSGIKEFAIRLLQRRLQFKEFWALKGVSFNVSAGEVFGIIGSNGAGKSTMLKVMARVLQPTRGRVVMRGHVAPLLELGGGFHQELNGRENIYLNMALLGFTRRQTDELFDEIVEFAEIKDFIDAPLRTYSTGMVARLGFSVATCTQPDILLVDEVLSVGDPQFQQKCLNRMDAYRQTGTTIVLVSHSMGTVQTFCDQAMWLNHGVSLVIGEPGDVIEQYLMGYPGGKVAETRGSKLSTQTDYQELDPRRQIYPADQIFSPEGGSLSAWARYDFHRPDSAAVFFHTDDSRFVLYSQALVKEQTRREYVQITARAGGNRRVPDNPSGEFPEQSAVYFLENLRLGEWIHLTMTWQGYPDGILKLYLNGELVGQRSYNSAYSDDRQLPQKFSVGMRPLNWPGELVRQPDGTVRDLRPGSTMAIEDANVSLRDVRLYPDPLKPEEVLKLYKAGFDQPVAEVSPSA